MPSLRYFAPRSLAVLVAVTLLAATSFSMAGAAQEATTRPTTRKTSQKAVEKAAKDKAITLEEAFPDKSPFGPTATGMTFSADGRFAAFLYRPYAERRHGSDLYIYDVETRQSRRVTSASRMAEFQAEARKVVEDRTKKAKAARHPKVKEIEARSKGDDKDQKKAKQAPPTTGPTTAPTTAPTTPQTDALSVLPGIFGGRIGTSSDVAKVEPGTSCRLIIEADGKVLNGQLHAGLIRLPLRQIVIEADTVTAAVGDGQDGIDGVFEATLTTTDDSATLAGTIALTLPELELSFEVVREGSATPVDSPAVATKAPAEKPEAKNSEPKRQYAAGILNATGEQLELGDLVTEKDADADSRTPRYGGVQSIEWSPKGHQILLLSEGDVYLLEIDPKQWDKKDDAGLPYRGEIERLTHTREREASVAFLPDGSGYTYLREGALLRVSFGDHRIVQLDPALGRGERMVGYRISPNGQRLVFLAERSLGAPTSGDWRGGRGGDGEETERGGGRQVTLVSYRDRFAQVRQVRRAVADDDHPPSQVSIYLYDLEGHGREKSSPQRVFTRRSTGPRDVMYVPEWSPDSEKVAFSAFEQETDQVVIVEARLDPEAVKKAEAQEAAGGEAERRGRGDRNDEDDNDGEPQDRGPGGPSTGPAGAESEFQVDHAKVVYRFLHNGGPNTPRMIVPQYLADSRHMVFITELSGFRQLHVLDPVYEQLEQITSGRNEVYPFDISEDHKRLFVTATAPEDPAQEWVYEVDLETRKMRRLCAGDAVMDRVAVADDGSHLLAMKDDFGGPSELVAFDCSGQTPEAYTLSDFHPEAAHEATGVKPEYFSFENRHGHTIHGHMFKPADWKASDKRPLLIYVYGGPLGERKMISRGSYAAPSYFFARYMTENHGWVTATVDPRGASGFGALFEKANFEQVGKPQTEDLVDAADWLVENAGVDPKRRALHGWSFGGFQTQMTMYTEPDAFAAGIAGAGPTEWQNYNSWYTTGTVGARGDFKEDLDQYSLLPLAKNLKGRLLLVHGMEDSNVLYQDTVRVYRELLKAGKESVVDLFVDPTGGHGLGGDVKTIGRYRKYEDFLLTHIGKGESSGTETEESEGAPERLETAASAE